MLSKIKLVEEQLHNAFLQEINVEKEEFAESQASWKKSLKDINFWQFLSVNYLYLNRFFTMLDVEKGPESGWEKFVELLGLVLWEDRKWCEQYHGGLGPTRTSLIRLIERGLYDKDLSLGVVAEIIEEMGRFDILRQIDWKFLMENFESKSEALFEAGKDSARVCCLKFQAYSTANDQLVKSECINPSNYDQRTMERTLEKKSARMKKLKGSPTDICVLFSYASDAEVFAEKVANHLRNSGENDAKIRILMIGESRIKRFLASDRNNILHKWFHQVRYVVPILSPDYLKHIQNLDCVDVSHGEDDVSLLNRLIYRLALDQFVSLGSRNLRCRPICPKEFDRTVKGNVCARANGLLSPTWSCDTPEELNNFRLVLCDEPLM